MKRANSLRQSLKIILAVSLVCSFFVSLAAITLHALQQQNQQRDRDKHVLIAAGLYQKGIDIARVYNRQIEPVMIELHSGNRVKPTQFGEDFTVDNFDIQRFANDTDYGEDIAAKADIAKLKRRPRYMVVYLVKSGQQVNKLVLPVFGKGLWSTIYGYLALDRNLQTITGITFYQHGETPGLGGEIDNPAWKKQWRGKQAFDSRGRVAIKVVRGEVDVTSPAAKYQVDGLAGATLTSRGVNQMLKYWLGERGYGPLLTRLRRQWQPASRVNTG